MQLDNGAFHKAQKLKIPENRVLLFQPAYSPDIHPIERVWQHLKKESSWVNFNTLADLQEKICEQLNNLGQKVIASLAGYPFILSALENVNL
jgi:transposase